MLINLVKYVLCFKLFLTVFVASVVITGFGNDAPFDTATWQNSNARDRGRMAQHLVDGNGLVSKSRLEVLETLGEPARDYGKVLEYRIDLGWPIKSYGLQVHFDADRNVELVKIVD